MPGVIFALAAALSWGSGDFYGGLATRKSSQFQVLLLTTSSSLVLLVLFAVLSGEQRLTQGDIGLAIASGVCGALGLAALYRGLSLGNAALVSPVAGVIGAVIPALVGLFMESLPGPWVLLGFALSIAGIWWVARPKDGTDQIERQGLGLALLAGLGFGGFLTIIAQFQGDQVFLPLVFSKFTSLLLAGFLLKARQLPFPGLADSPVAILSGFLDAGGNILYLVATQLVRLDVAALLSSLYPVGTVLLSGLLLKERVSRSQWLGVCACLCAILLITSGG